MLTRILQIEPGSVKDRMRLGRILLDGREWMRALAQYTLALQADPRNADALYGFVRAAMGNNMPDRALEAARKGVAQFPKDQRFPQIIEQMSMAARP